MFKSLSLVQEYACPLRITPLDYTFHTASASSHLRITDGHLEGGIFHNSLDCLFFRTQSQLYTKTNIWLRGLESNQRSSGYEPDELPLLHPAIVR